jgi:hypothetical protein
VVRLDYVATNDLTMFRALIGWMIVVNRRGAVSDDDPRLAAPSSDYAIWGLENATLLEDTLGWVFHGWTLPFATYQPRQHPEEVLSVWVKSYRFSPSLWLP